MAHLLMYYDNVNTFIPLVLLEGFPRVLINITTYENSREMGVKKNQINKDVSFTRGKNSVQTHPRSMLMCKRNKCFGSNTTNLAASYVLWPITIPQRLCVATASKIVDLAQG